ncbi:MAG: hypothetical protein ACO1N0_00105 [Fluviicola sp.]
MKELIRSFVLTVFLLGINTSYAQRKIASSKVVVVEQEGDSVFCREQELVFEVLDFEFDSCSFNKNSYSLAFQLINRTKQTLFLDPVYMTWYDSNYLRAKGSDFKSLKPDQTIWITLESVCYAKKQMNSPGKLLLLYDKKEVYISMRLKHKSSKVIRCVGEQLFVK